MSEMGEHRSSEMSEKGEHRSYIFSKIEDQEVWLQLMANFSIYPTNIFTLTSEIGEKGEYSGWANFWEMTDYVYMLN